LKEAAHIALTAAIDYLWGSGPEVTIDVVRFVLFDQKTHDVFEETLKELKQIDNNL
jgi:O-acetyl-ADP-ribose deacetylase (regulator of RNase III)